jgi:hypothetical protein
MTLANSLELLHKKLDELLEIERRREQDSFDRATLERSVVQQAAIAAGRAS